MNEDQPWTPDYVMNHRRYSDRPRQTGAEKCGSVIGVVLLLAASAVVTWLLCG